MTEITDTGGCDRSHDLVSFLYGELDRREAREFERHLSICAVCESELQVFQPTRESLVEWRNQSLAGLSDLGFATDRVSVRPRKRSALAAIREFLDLSPLWFKAATASAALIFCAIAVVGTRGLLITPNRSEPNQANQSYSKEQFENAVRERVAQVLATKSPEGPAKQHVKMTPGDEVKPQVSNKQRASPGAMARNPTHREASKPLTRAEREQLAADLRLTSSRNEEDLQLLSDRINR